MKPATKSMRPVGIAATLILLLTGCATAPEHPTPADYCNGGVLICVSANGHSEWDRGEAFSCRCDYSGTLTGGLDGNPAWVKRALAAKGQQNQRGTNAARERKAGKAQQNRD